MRVKYFNYLLLFVGIFFITNSVFAVSMSYDFYECNGARWSNKNTCAGSSSRVPYDDVLTINYFPDGSVSLDLKSDAFNEDSDSKLGNLKLGEPNTYYTEEIRTGYIPGVAGTQVVHYKWTYDLTSLSKYYSKTNTIPDNIVVMETHSGSGYHYYFGVSEFELVTNELAGNRKMYYFSNNESLTEVMACNDLIYYKKELEDKIAKLGNDHPEVEEIANKLGNQCANYLAYNKETENSCYTLCKNLKGDIANMGIDIFNETNSCGFGERMVGWLVRILKLIRFIVPILVIVLSTFEYIGAMMANEDDAFKKVGGRFGKRLFIMILFFVLPSLLQFIFNIFNVPGLSSSNPYCLK